MNSAFPPGSCCTDGAGEDVLELAGSLSSGRGSGQVQDRGRERGSNSGSISTCGGVGTSAMSGSNRLSLSRRGSHTKHILIKMREKPEVRKSVEFKVFSEVHTILHPLVATLKSAALSVLTPVKPGAAFMAHSQAPPSKRYDLMVHSGAL